MNPVRKAITFFKGAITLWLWTQKQAAVFFGETQPRISDLINGDIERFSINKLVIMIAQAGMDIHVEVNIKVA